MLETQFHVFTLKNFRNYAGIMLHPVWLKQCTHDYDGIIYLSLSVTVKRFQLSHYQYYNFRPKHNTLKMLNGLFHWKWLGNTSSFRSLECFLHPAYERIAWSGCLSSPLRITWHISLGLKWNVMQSIFFIFLAFDLSPKPKQSCQTNDQFQESARLFLQDCWFKEKRNSN